MLHPVLLEHNSPQTCTIIQGWGLNIHESVKCSGVYCTLADDRYSPSKTTYKVIKPIKKDRKGRRSFPFLGKKGLYSFQRKLLLFILRQGCMYVFLDSSSPYATLDSPQKNGLTYFFFGCRFFVQIRFGVSIIATSWPRKSWAFWRPHSTVKTKKTAKELVGPWVSSTGTKILVGIFLDTDFLEALEKCLMMLMMNKFEPGVFGWG